MASHSGVSTRGERKDLNWAKNLRPLPKFTTEQIHNHLDGCGKRTLVQKGTNFSPKVIFMMFTLGTMRALGMQP